MILKPAPWKLNGEAFVAVYKFSKQFVNQYGFLEKYQIDNFDAGFGTIMCVNYSSSAVGPYFELLFIPGVINLKSLNLGTIKSGFSISKIFVSTNESVQNGINNWGIPKEVADFEWISLANNHVQVKVMKDGVVFFDAIFKRNSFKFPITTSIIPLKVIQKKGNKYFLTKPSAKGKGSFASIKKLEIKASHFPNLIGISPWIVSNISDLEMTFPIPTVVEI
jgi:hypothetical protein